MSITVLTSPTLPRHLQADRLDAVESSRAGLPGGVSIISRDSVIPVQHEQPDGGFSQVMQHVVTVQLPVASSAELPPDAGDALVAPDYKGVESGIGVNNPSRGPSVVSPSSLIPTDVEPQINAYTKSPTPQPMSAAQQAAQAEAQRQAQYPHPQYPVPQRRVRVRMSNRGMGKVTVSVRAVSVSETCVILAYPKEADNIIEPPICGIDNPIRVDYGADSYQCVFGGWTADMENMFLVILIRVEDEKR